MLTLRILAGLLVVLAAAAHAEESCRTCHPDVKFQYDLSLHSRQFGCTGCHGGDPAVLDVAAHSPQKAYIGKPQRQRIPELCATCHSDPNRMKPYGMPTDQYAQYQTSQHGVLLAAGDARVAICTDCHGVHAILPRGEPNSPVAPNNIPVTCGRCHADATLMASYNEPYDQVDKFVWSVHGSALLVEEHPTAPNCTTCHGKHGATALQGEAVVAVCGHCHSRTRAYFNEGPHHLAAKAAKISECVSCHGYHDTQVPDRSLFDTVCLDCHPQDSEAFNTGQKLKTLLVRADESIEAAAREMSDMEESFPTVVRFRPRLQQARAYFMEALPVQHALDTERVEDLTRNARSIAEEVRALMHALHEERHLRYIGLAAIWVVILFTIGVAYLYRRERRASLGGAARTEQSDKGGTS